MYNIRCLIFTRAVTLLLSRKLSIKTLGQCRHVDESGEILKWHFNQKAKHFVVSAQCVSRVYQKSDGKYYCTFNIRDTLTWYDADKECKLKGGRLPEVLNAAENFELLKLRVIISDPIRLQLSSCKNYISKFMDSTLNYIYVQHSGVFWPSQKCPIQPS